MGRHWQFYVIVALPILYFIVFKYVPMYGHCSHLSDIV